MGGETEPDGHHLDIQSAKLVTYLPAILVSAAFTAIIVQYSFRYGRLLIYPQYDDVSYLVDGLRRLDRVYQGSPTVFFRDWIHSPPRGPFSTLLAFAAFLIFGVHDWAPYAANVIVVLGFVVFTEKIMADTPALCRWCAIIFVVSTPVSAMAVHEFRPDIACALLTTMGVVALLGARISAGPQTRPVLGGILFGLALFAKPTVFPLTIGVLLAAMLCALVRDALLEPAKFDRRAGLRSVGVFVVIALAVAAPFYLVGTKFILQYIYDVQFGRLADIFTTRVPLWQHALFYLSDIPARVMLGPHRFLMLALIALWALLLRLVPSRARIANTLAYSAVIFVAYLGVTFNWQKSHFLGLAFQLGLMFFSVLILRGLVDLERERGWRMPWARVLIVATAALGLMLFQWPKFLHSEEIARAGEIQQVNDRIFDAVIQSSASARSRIIVTASGRINGTLFDYRAQKRRLPFTFVNMGQIGDFEAHRAAWSEADFVIAGEQGNSETSMMQHAYAIQDQLLAALRARPDFVEIVAVPTLNGKSIFVFKNIGRVPRQ